MKIAVIGAKGLPPQQGGIEYHCAEIYPRMVEQGHTVDLYARSSYNQSSWWESYDYQGVSVRTVPSLALRGGDALWTSALAAIATTGRHYDVIHFHALGPALWSGIPRLLSPCSKVVVTCHSLDWQRDKWGRVGSTLIRGGEHCAMQFGHEVAVVAQELQPYFKSAYDRQLPYIGNGPATYQPSDQMYSFVQSQGLCPSRYILFLGRLVPEKCPDLLVKAFQTLRPEGWKLAIAGGASDTPSYMSHLMELAMDDPDIVLMGQLKGKHLAETMRGAGFCVLPSALEGLPLVLLEAMHEGIPAIASNIPVHTRLLDDERGLLFKQGNIDDCIAQLRWAMGHPNAMHMRAKRAQAYIQKHHSWDHIAADWLALYRQVCQSTRATPYPNLTMDIQNER